MLDSMLTRTPVHSTPLLFYVTGDFTTEMSDLPDFDSTIF